MTVYGTPPSPAQSCDRCGRLFEVSLAVDGKALPGHPVGHPTLCVPLTTMLRYGDRDARRRRASRRGR